jgi:hypothetical protein
MLICKLAGIPSCLFSKFRAGINRQSRKNITSNEKMAKLTHMLICKLASAPSCFSVSFGLESTGRVRETPPQIETRQMASTRETTSRCWSRTSQHESMRPGQAPQACGNEWPERLQHMRLSTCRFLNWRAFRLVCSVSSGLESAGRETDRQTDWFRTTRLVSHYPTGSALQAPSTTT